MSTSSFKFLQFGFLLTAARGALAGWFSWLERHPIHPRVSGLIPVRAHTGGNLLMFLTSMFLSPLLFTLSLKSVTYLWMRIKKKKEKAARGILATPPPPWDSHAHQQGPHCLSHSPLLNLEALDLLLQLPQLLPCRDLGMDTAGKGVKWSPSFAPSGWSLTPGHQDQRWGEAETFTVHGSHSSLLLFSTRTSRCFFFSPFGPDFGL